MVCVLVGLVQAEAMDFGPRARVRSRREESRGQSRLRARERRRESGIEQLVQDVGARGVVWALVPLQHLLQYLQQAGDDSYGFGDLIVDLI